MSVSIEGFRLPRYHEIPDVGLYLDQTIKYINRSLAPLGCVEITASMVSNYVKKGYIDNLVKKQYSDEQIARLMFMTLAKTVLTMENIARLFAVQKASYSSQVAYDYFCTELENMLRHVFGLQEALETVGTTDTPQKAMLRSVIIAVTNVIYLSDRLEAMTGAEDAAPAPCSRSEAT